MLSRTCSNRVPWPQSTRRWQGQCPAGGCSALTRIRKPANAPFRSHRPVPRASDRNTCDEEDNHAMNCLEPRHGSSRLVACRERCRAACPVLAVGYGPSGGSSACRTHGQWGWAAGARYCRGRLGTANAGCTAAPGRPDGGNGHRCAARRRPGNGGRYPDHRTGPAGAGTAVHGEDPAWWAVQHHCGPLQASPPSARSEPISTGLKQCPHGRLAGVVP